MAAKRRSVLTALIVLLIAGSVTACLGYAAYRSKQPQEYVVTWVEQPPPGIAATDLGPNRAGPPPTIDGVVGEREWERARQVSPPGPTSGAEPTAIRLAYDEECLYVAVECWDSQITPPAEDFYKNDSLWVLIKIGAFGEKRSSSFSFRLTPHGLFGAQVLTGLDEALPSRSLVDRSRPLDNRHYRAAVARTQRGWSAEIALPWSALEWRIPIIAEPLRFLVERRNINAAQIEVSDWPYDQNIRFVWASRPRP